MNADIPEDIICPCPLRASPPESVHHPPGRPGDLVLTVGGLAALRVTIERPFRQGRNDRALESGVEGLTEAGSISCSPCRARFPA